MSKKSYMNRGNILNESFLSGLFSAIKTGKLKKWLSMDKIDKKMFSHLNNINDAVTDMEKAYQEIYGKKVNLRKFQASDFKD